LDFVGAFDRGLARGVHPPLAVGLENGGGKPFVAGGVVEGGRQRDALASGKIPQTHDEGFVAADLGGLHRELARKPSRAPDSEARAARQGRACGDGLQKLPAAAELAGP